MLRKLAVTGEVSAERAGNALEDFQSLALERYSHDLLAARAWDLRENFSAYDAMYVALAEAISDAGSVLLTADVRLARAVREHVSVDVLLVDRGVAP